ncbi:MULTISPECIES: hypothetical protein [Sorangium]|uniref:hypothetical protein n=1 Tax=Sorangium TaxID=39643 RepID=UPI0002F114AF|nr:hypothetical protein [Sorangium cellulosum]
MSPSPTPRHAVSGACQDGGSGRLRTPEGAELAFRARPAALDRIEGLYAAVDGGCRTGAVVFTPVRPLRR